MERKSTLGSWSVPGIIEEKVIKKDNGKKKWKRRCHDLGAKINNI